MFVTSLIFESNAETYRVVPVMEFHSKDKLLVLAANVRLGWNILTVTNTLAYNGKEFYDFKNTFSLN